MERARSDMLRAAGIDQRGAAEAGDGVYAIADLGIRYMRPARLDDALLVRSRVVEVRAAATVIGQRIERDGDLLADATVTAVLLRSEEHTSELQSLMRISYAVFCFKKKQEKTNNHTTQMNSYKTRTQQTP